MDHEVTPRFEGFGARGGDESFYVRAVDPRRPRAVWLRHTVHHAPGVPAVGSIWLTVFDADADADAAPVTRKATLLAPATGGRWLRVGESVIGPDGVRGRHGDARWDIGWGGDEPLLRHLPKAFMYSAPLPRTKLESPPRAPWSASTRSCSTCASPAARRACG